MSRTSLYGAERVNSDGADWGDPAGIAQLEAELRASVPGGAVGGPIIGGRVVSDASGAVISPANSLETVGMSRDATDAEIIEAMDIASRAQPNWDATPAEQRAACLDRAAELLEERRGLFLRLLVKEGGKTLPDAVAELREAIDFCRYYGARGRELFAEPQELRGPTGERNLLSLQGRGVFVCISPWNFPLAIFTGQVVAALMAGNSVIAKPAPATPLVAHAMTACCTRPGCRWMCCISPLPMGRPLAKSLCSHPALAGVAFTGSTATATRSIGRSRTATAPICRSSQRPAV